MKVLYKWNDCGNDCYAENAICCIDNVMTMVKGFQGKKHREHNIGCVERSSVCKRP